MGQSLTIRCVACAGLAATCSQNSYFSTWSIRARVALVLLASYLPTYLDGAEHGAPKRRSAIFSMAMRKIWKVCIPYFFDVRIAVLEDRAALASCKQYILSIHPHGVLSLCHLLTVAGYDAALETVLPQQRRSALSAGVLFKIPFVRELALCTGCVDASRATASRCLAEGLSLSVVPGGEREQLLAQRGPVESLILKNRKGFIRLALSSGVPVVPVYCFGEGQMYYQSKLFFGFRSWLQRTLGVAWVLPYGPGGIPGRHFSSPPVQLVIGAPLEMPAISKPTEAEVDMHHARYVAALEALFAKHKDAMEYKHIELNLL